jgi:hypothetical protein
MLAARLVIATVPSFRSSVKVMALCVPVITDQELIASSI